MISKCLFSRSAWVHHLIIVLLPVIFFSACSGTTGKSRGSVVKEKEYTSEGNLSYKSTTIDEQVISELQRVFENKSIEGIGIFESSNEGLARRTATNLAVAELAGQVQTLVRSDSTIYNNKDIQDVVENRVHALVNNYRIESVGYDPGTNIYRVRVVLNGESITREIEKYIQ